MRVIIFNNIDDFNDCNNRIKAALEITLKTGMDNYTDPIHNNVTNEEALHYHADKKIQSIIDSVLLPNEIVVTINETNENWFPKTNINEEII